MNDYERALPAHHARELEGCRRAFEAGNVPALISALSWCEEWNLPPPAWVTKAARNMLIVAMRNQWPRKPGRLATPFARARQHLIDFARHGMVELIRRKQRELRQEVAELRREDDVPPHLLKQSEALLCRAGRTWHDAYSCAAEDLCGTEAFASPETIKASYLRVERDSRDPVKALLYRLPDNRTLYALGLEGVFERKRAGKPADRRG